MTQVITATYVDGVLKPCVELHLTPGMKVRLTVEPWDGEAPMAPSACDELDELCEQFPIESGGVRLTRDQLHERR